jgi:hypothetical protein
MLDMDVGKEIIFSLVGLNNSSCGARITHRLFSLALVQNLIEKLQVYIARDNPWADHCS